MSIRPSRATEGREGGDRRRDGGKKIGREEGKEEGEGGRRGKERER